MNTAIFESDAYKNALEHLRKQDIQLPWFHQGAPIGINEKKKYCLQFITLRLMENLPKFLFAVDRYAVHGLDPEVQPFVTHLALILKLKELSSTSMVQEIVADSHGSHSVAYQQALALGEIAARITSGQMVPNLKEIREAAHVLLSEIYTLCEEDHFPWEFDTLCTRVLEYQFK